MCPRLAGPGCGSAGGDAQRLLFCQGVTALAQLGDYATTHAPSNGLPLDDALNRPRICVRCDSNQARLLCIELRWCFRHGGTMRPDAHDMGERKPRTSPARPCSPSRAGTLQRSNVARPKAPRPTTLLGSSHARSLSDGARSKHVARPWLPLRRQPTRYEAVEFCANPDQRRTGARRSARGIVTPTGCPDFSANSVPCASGSATDAGALDAATAADFGRSSGSVGKACWNR